MHSIISIPCKLFGRHIVKSRWCVACKIVVLEQDICPQLSSGSTGE